MKLDIACGEVKEPGWVGIDQAALPGVDIVCDLFTFPWPIETGCVEELRCSHFLEHVPAKLRPAFFNEVWRILKPGAIAGFVTPLGLYRQCQDFTHEWPPIVPASYLYWSQGWLKENRLDHYREVYGIRCNFDITELMVAMDPSQDSTPHAERQRLIDETPNGPGDLIAILRKLEV
jgi:hypothetical protein